MYSRIVYLLNHDSEAFESSRSGGVGNHTLSNFLSSQQTFMVVYTRAPLQRNRARTTA